MTDSRIDLIMNFLGETPISFAEKLGTTKEYIYMIQKGSRPISKQLANKIEKVFGIPYVFSKDGQGEIDIHPNLMDRSSAIEQKVDHITTAPTLTTEDHGVPYYDIDFIGGFDRVYNEETVKPSYFIDFPPYNDCDCWINVTGKSMGPLIAHGDIVALKKLNNWREFLLMGEIYAVITDEFRTIKILGAGQDDDHYTLIPYNKGEEYSKQPIPKHLIKNMFRVKGAIKKFF